MLDGIDPVAALAAFVAAQVLSTLWFTVLFGEPWAREFGVASRQEHTSAIPGWTYAVQAACTLAIVLTIAGLQAALGVTSLGGAVGWGLVFAIGLCAANLIPGQAFLGRWRVAAITVGCQASIVVLISAILGAWR